MRELKQEKMGEVHVRVRLSNAVDVTLASEGRLDPDLVRSFEVDAVVDTGSTRSIISGEVFQKLGLAVLGEACGRLADGRRIQAGITSGIVFDIEGRRTLEDAYLMGDAVLIGQTVLESTDLLVDCANRRVIPNPAHPEGLLHRF